MNIRLAYRVEATSSDELVAVRSHNAQPEHSPPFLDGVIWQHCATTFELPFT